MVTKQRHNAIQAAIQRAIDHFGTKAKLARAVHVTQPAIDHWIKRGRVGHKAAKEIEKATNGEIKRTELTDFFD